MRLRQGLICLCLVQVMVQGLAPGSGRAQTPAPEYDVLIRDGRIVDGSGNPSFRRRRGHQGRADRGGGPAGRQAGARAPWTPPGLVVAPGFIDIHSHADSALLVDGGACSAVHQGITTVILGEGPSMAPSRSSPTFSDYFAKLTRQGIAINAGSYVGSSQIWTRGARGQGRTAHRRRTRAHAGAGPADDAGRGAGRVELAVRSARVAGSTPTRWWRCARRPRRSAASTPPTCATRAWRCGAAVDEALAIGRRAKLPVDIIHLKISEHTLWGQMPRLMAKIAAARAAGADVQANVYPYWAGQNDLATIVPPWAHEGGSAALIARLKDPAQRQRIQKEITSGLPGWYNHYTATGSWEGMLLASLSDPEYKRFEGKRMSDVIAALRRRQAVRRVLPGADRQRRLGADGLLSPRREGHGVRPATAVRLASARTAAR